MKNWKDYTCHRCSVTRGVKTKSVSEDGFVYKVTLCPQCFEDLGLTEIKEFKKEKEDGTETKNASC